MSKLNVASFPWDPPPPQPAPVAPAAPAAAAAAAAAAPPATAPAPQGGTPSYTSAQLSPPPNAQPLPLANGLPAPNGAQAKSDAAVKQEPAIKQEPGIANTGMPPAHSGNAPQQYGGNPNGPHNVAAQRAMSQLQNQYGAAAAASISAIQGFGQGGQGQGASASPRPAGAAAQPGQAQRPASQAQYAQQMANRTAAMQQQQQQQPRQPQGAPVPYPGQGNPPTQQNGFQQSQVDGAGDDFEGVLLRRNENGETSEMGRVDVDRLLHQQIASRAKQMEGGGLMLPLKQATKHKSIATKSGLGGPSGFDGIDDELKREEEDEDAINSDLDDPNEVDIGEEDDDENMDQVMLCMYDKVQRVKNKWYVLTSVYLV